MCTYIIFIILSQKAVDVHNYRFFWKGLGFKALRLDVLKVIYSAWVLPPPPPPPKKPPFILEEELVHYYYNSIQFLSKLFKTISSHKNSRYYPLDADITILFVASKGKKIQT